MQEMRKQYQIITDLRTDIRSLQGDNLKLYEKVRYMQSYQSEASGSGVRGTLDPLPANSSSRPDDISKYRTRYEEAMNPFEVFRGRVRGRQFYRGRRRWFTHRHSGSSQGVLKHESGRKGPLLVNASDLGEQKGSNGVYIVRLRVTSIGIVHDVGVRFEWKLARSVPETAQSICTSPPFTLTGPVSSIIFT